MPKKEINGLTEFYEQFGIRPRYGEIGCDSGTPAINRIMGHVHYVVDRQIIDLQNRLEVLSLRVFELEKRMPLFSKKILFEPLRVANRFRCECGNESFLIDTTGINEADNVIDLIECFSCHKAYVMKIRNDTDDA